MFTFRLFFVVGFIGLFGSFAISQEVPEIPKIKNKATGRWVNIHEKRTDLLGVKVQQFPDNPHAAKDYEGKHPAMIIYVFKNLDAHQIEFNPDGSISGGFWWKLGNKHPILKEISKI